MIVLLKPTELPNTANNVNNVNPLKTKVKSILKPSSRQHATSKILIDRVERSVKKRINLLKPSINKPLKSKSSTFKKSFKNRYNRYVNVYTRNQIRKKLGKDTRKRVKFSNNYTHLGTKI